MVVGVKQSELGFAAGSDGRSKEDDNPVVHDGNLQLVADKLRQQESRPSSGSLAASPSIVLNQASFRIRVDDDVDNTLENMTNLTRARAQLLAQNLDRYEDIEDAPAYIQACHTQLARDLTSAFQLPQVQADTPLISVLRVMASDEIVVVRNCFVKAERTKRDFLFGRSVVMEHALGVDDLYSSIEDHVHRIPEIGKLQSGDTLARAMHTMTASGYSVLGITNEDGTITGVLTAKAVHDYMLEMMEQETPVMRDHTKSKFKEIAEMEGDEAITAATVQKQKNHKKQMRSIGKMQRVAQEWVQAAWTEIMILLLVLLDLGLTIYEATLPTDELGGGVDNPLNVVTGAILFVFAYEAGVRVYGYRKAILRRVLDIIDLIIVVTSIVVFILVISENGDKQIKNVVVVARVLRFLRLIKILKQLRKVVKVNKLRYTEHGFDLDLAFITPQCIAMSVPAEGMEAAFRNPIEEVQRFFETLHSDRYIIYDVAQASYDPSYFNGRVERMDTEHRNPPTMQQVVSFLEKMTSFIDEDPMNVAAIHCVSGLSRTGIFVSAWLLHSSFASQAEDAMEWFAKQRRGPKAKAYDVITQPSQRRYVYYVEEMVSRGGFRTNRITLHGLKMWTVPSLKKKSGSGCDLFFTVEENGILMYDYKTHHKVQHATNNQEEVVFDNFEIQLAGDIRVTFYDRTEGPLPQDQVICYFWFHTGFIADVCTTMAKPFIDMADSDKLHSIFKENFKIDMYFEGIPVEGDDIPPTPHSKADTNAKTELGIFRKLLKPSARVVEMSHKRRGLAQRTQSRGVKVQLTQDDKEESFSLVPVDGNIMSAQGPAVLHHPPELFEASAGAGVHGHKQAKKLGKKFKDSSTNFVTKAARTLVSGQKKRFQEDGFDLDLTYVTPRIIAMGFPSTGMEKRYRNSQDEVYRFFQERHAGHYKIINLCSERAYDLELFHGSVTRYPFADHQPPALELILACCSHVHSFMQEDENNVVAIHCKAGKGRTGLMIVCSLLYGGLATTAIEARNYYDTQRTYNKKGLTIISQIRFAHYFEAQLRRIKKGEDIDVRESESPAMVLQLVKFHNIPHMDRDGGCDPFVNVFVKAETTHERHKLFSSLDNGRPSHAKPSDGEWTCELKSSITGTELRVAGDVLLEFFDYDTMFKPKKLCNMWLHTHFMIQPPDDMCGRAVKLTDAQCAKRGVKPGTYSLMLQKHEIDGAASDKKSVKFDPEFKIEVLFYATGSKGTGKALQDAIATAAENAKSPGTGKAKDSKNALYHEREAYEKDCRQRAIKGYAPISFEEFHDMMKQETATNNMRKPTMQTRRSSQSAPRTRSGSFMGSKRNSMDKDASTPQGGPPEEDADERYFPSDEDAEKSDPPRGFGGPPSSGQMPATLQPASASLLLPQQNAQRTVLKDAPSEAADVLVQMPQDVAPEPPIWT